MIPIASVAISSWASPPAIEITIPAGIHTFDAGKEKAEWFRRFARALAGQAPGQTVDLIFAPGYHEFRSTFNLTGKRVNLIGRKGATLSGGPEIHRWRTVTDPSILKRIPESVRSEAVEFDLSSSGLGKLGAFTERGFGCPASPSFTELFEGGKPLVPARYPSAPGDQWLKTGKVGAGRSFGLADQRPLTWKPSKDIWAYGYWMFDWAESWEPVRSITDQGVNLEETGSGPIKAYGLKEGRRYYFSNVLEELSNEGEFYLDFEKNRLITLRPTASLSHGDAFISLLGTPLISIDHGRNIQIEHLRLEGSRANLVDISNSDHVSVTNCELRDAGAGGVAISGSTDCGVQDSLLQDLGAFGVSLDGGNRATLVPGDNFVEGCTIRRIARLCRTYQPAVLMNGVGNRAVANTISDLPHQAFLFGGNDQLIERNDIRRVCLETGDSGAIYTGRDVTTRGTIIKWNRFREIEPRVKEADGSYTGVMSVYLDDCQAGISVIGNLFESKDTAIMIGGGRDNTVAGNIFMGSNPGIAFDQRGRGWAKKLFSDEWGMAARIKAVPALSEVWKRHYPKLYADLKNQVDMSFATGNEVVGNFISTPNWIQYQDGLTVKDLDYRQNQVVTGPVTLADALAAVAKLYGPIPLDKIGAGKVAP